MTYRGNSSWLSRWVVHAERRSVYVAVVADEDSYRIVLRTGGTATPVALDTDEAADLRDHIQSAIDDCELRTYRDRGVTDALNRLRAAPKDPPAGLEHAIVDAIIAGATFAQAAGASRLTENRIRDVWNSLNDTSLSCPACRHSERHKNPDAARESSRSTQHGGNA